MNPLTWILFFGVLAFGLAFTAYSLYVDVNETGVRATTWVPFALLGVAGIHAMCDVHRCLTRPNSPWSWCSVGVFY
jgi:hypothetical protein